MVAVALQVTRLVTISGRQGISAQSNPTTHSTLPFAKSLLKEKYYEIVLAGTDVLVQVVCIFDSRITPITSHSCLPEV